MNCPKLIYIGPVFFLLHFITSFIKKKKIGRWDEFPVYKTVLQPYLLSSNDIEVRVNESPECTTLVKRDTNIVNFGA